LATTSSTSEEFLTRRRGSLGRLAGSFALVVVGLCGSLLLLEVLARAVVPRRDNRLVFDAELGWHNAPARQVTYKGEGFVTTTYLNSLGLRAPEPSEAAGAGERRILALGDSMVEGIHVSDQQLVTARIQQVLTDAGKRIEVVNAGVSGYGTLQQALLANRVGPVLRPRGVVLFVTLSNDLRDNIDRYGGRRPVAILDRSDSYTVDPPRMSKLSVKIREWLQHFELAYLLRESLARIPYLREAVVNAGLAHVDADLSGKGEEEGLRVLEVVVPRLRRDSLAWGTRWMLIVIIPRRGEVEGGEVGRRVVRERIQALCARYDVHCLDLLPVFRTAYRERQRPLFPYGGHWDTAGHLLAGRAVAARILEMSLLVD
jgi:hypothetical protein